MDEVWEEWRRLSLAALLAAGNVCRKVLDIGGACVSARDWVLKGPEAEVEAEAVGTGGASAEANVEERAFA